MKAEPLERLAKATKGDPIDPALALRMIGDGVSVEPCELRQLSSCEFRQPEQRDEVRGAIKAPEPGRRTSKRLAHQCPFPARWRRPKCTTTKTGKTAQMGTMIDRVQRELTDADVARIAGTYQPLDRSRERSRATAGLGQAHPTQMGLPARQAGEGN
jgi:hypothetical protein